MVAVDIPDEVAAAEAWFARWGARLAYRSETMGCRCCIEMWDVEAPPQAVAEIPPALRGITAWSEPDLFGPEFAAPPAAAAGPARHLPRRRSSP